MSRKIFFNEKLHAYTDDLNNRYISTTTQIGDYKEGFKSKEIAKACEAIGKNPNHPKYLKYKGKSASLLLKEWEVTKTEACAKGNVTHNYLEDSIKSSTGYIKSKASTIFKNDRIYTVDDIIENPNYGILDLDTFVEANVHIKYPQIYALMLKFHNAGFKFYAEVCTYNYEYLKAGLIDNLVLKYPYFWIIDWKTNRDKLRWDSGYFNKDNDGNVTDEWIPKDERFAHPLSHLAVSKLNEYTLQLSDYANMAERFGLIYKGSILCHIRDNKEKDNVVEFHKLPYFKDEVQNMARHYYENNVIDKRKVQMELNFKY